MNLYDHPIWTQTTPYKSRISPVKKPLHLLRIKLAKQYARLFKRELFIGVTGSVGKTACVRAIDSVLSEKIKVLSTKPDLDPILNIPITILGIRPNIKKVVLEMGIEFKGEMDFYLSLVKPKIAVVTRIYFAHSEYLGSIEDIIEEKGKLIEQLPIDGIAILNWDDIYCRKLAQKTKAEIIYFGKDQKNCSIWADKIRIEDYNTVFELNCGVERVEVKYQLVGEHQIYSALAAAAVGTMEGLSLIQIKRGLEKVTPADHRLQFMDGFNSSVILDDTYNNASPIGAEAAIDTLMCIPSRRKILVLGEMRELGNYSEQLHRQIARKIYQEKPDYVFLGTGDATIMADELLRLGFWEERLESNLQNSQIVSKLLKILSKGDVCLIKASRLLRMDEVVKRVIKKQ